MAFQQPTRQAAQRAFHPTAEDNAHQVPQPAVPTVEESQTWVLFSPVNDAATTTSYLTSTHHTESTPGRSLLSDLGSLHTIARSDSIGQQPSPSSHAVDDEDEEEDDAELDSLDSHLPEFRSTPHIYNSTPGLAPIVPAHDGLGSFRLDHGGMGADIQERLYAFERYNPRRFKRRRESLELAQQELDIEEEHEMDKMARIEAWRLEQSRCLLEEIQKEARRRRRSAASSRPDIDSVTEASVRNQIRTSSQETADEDDAWHDQQASDLGENETLWGRITRKVIRDIMGIDDKLLSILFGESLPDEDDLSSTPKASTMMPGAPKDTVMTDSEEASWQLKMLERIAKELGSFVHQISEHPGAFSTFTRMQQMPIPYAGLPPIAELANDASRASLPQDAPAPTIPEFKPTIPSQARPIDVPNAKAVPGGAPSASNIPTDNQGSNFTQDEWEQELDVRLIFRYLRSRFLSRSATTGSNSGSTHLGTSSSQDIAAKAARVRQHHPLVSKARPADRRSFKVTTPSSPVPFRRASSCATQSTRKSVRRSSCSSRHYWDIGAGSVGTGSLIAAAGPMGSWGEI